MKAANATALECKNEETQIVMLYVCTYSPSGTGGSVALAVGISVALLLAVLAVGTFAWVKYRHQIQDQLATYRRNHRVRQETG